MSCGVGGWLTGHAMGEGDRLQILCGGRVNGLNLVTEGEGGEAPRAPLGVRGKRDRGRRKARERGWWLRWGYRRGWSLEVATKTLKERGRVGRGLRKPHVEGGGVAEPQPSGTQGWGGERSE